MKSLQLRESLDFLTGITVTCIMAAMVIFEAAPAALTATKSKKDKQVLVTFVGGEQLTRVATVLRAALGLSEVEVCVGGRGRPNLYSMALRALDPLAAGQGGDQLVLQPREVATPVQNLCQQK